ncbi:MAG: chemotaxis protein CheW, partial [Sulfurimonadaceae bacterium]|nr:chemotaxis protein CheW [Sulfurimonadaceae bacterium]
MIESQLVDYKNFQIAPRVAPLIKHMDPVEANREKLHDLSKNWDSLSLLSQLGDAGVNMDEIKNNFTKLSSELINHLANELLNKKVSEMTSKAQVAVDIVIRNLFERTADIGFLATDEDIRELLRNHNSRYTEGYADDRAKIKERFLEYIGKYSVYFDIVLMNANGDILANIDETNDVAKSHDPVIKQVLTTTEEYVETYKAHDFLPHSGDSLVYSYKVTQNNAPDSDVLGVLCLCFKFEDEMEGIFNDLADAGTKECITLLDNEGRVIASSDRYHIPLDAKLEIVTDDYRIISFGGRDYLAKSCETNGYQGFYGLGWYGHIMIPVDYAFAKKQEFGFEMSRELLLAILQHGDQFSEDLKHIPIQAGSIQNNLNRALWNGSVKQSCSANHNKQFSRALLQEIRKTGESTKDIIGSSIARLTKTMVLGDSAFLANLIVDIMDRNLYERANDCRWWALTSDFRTIMDQPGISMDDQKKMNDILAYINELYTVYTNLFIYDTHGVVVAVSNPKESHLIGRRLGNEWVSKTLELTDSSKYYVSPFEPSNLYDGRHTYIYNAAIRSLEDESRVVGGIGIVFDSELQFDTMIRELL